MALEKDSNYWLQLDLDLNGLSYVYQYYKPSNVLTTQNWKHNGIFAE